MAALAAPMMGPSFAKASSFAGASEDSSEDSSEDETAGRPGSRSEGVLVARHGGRRERSAEWGFVAPSGVSHPGYIDPRHTFDTAGIGLM
jgi:hypothetical protein